MFQIKGMVNDFTSKKDKDSDEEEEEEYNPD
jgi:hypothetical protein